MDWVKINKATEELVNALTKRAQTEPSHLEKLEIYERNTHKDQYDEDIDEAQLESIMESHRAASPFKMDADAALTKWKEVSYG